MWAMVQKKHSLGHKINLPQTIAAQKPKTEQYVLQYADDEVLDFAPRKYFESIIPESKFNPNDYKKNKAEVVIRDRANMQGLNIYNDGLVGEKSGVNHFLGTDRRPFIRTLNNTLNYPDIKFTWEGKQHYSKKYTNNNSSHNFMDLVITKNGKIFNKFPTNENFINNKISGAQDLSFKAPLSNTFKPINGVSDNGDNISYIEAVVNRSLPNVSEVYRGLSDDAVAGMQQAISQGLDKTTQKAGSLESVYRIKNELDDMALAAKNSNAANYGALEQAQSNYSKLYANALQGQDKGFNLEQAYRAGLNNQAEALSTMSPLEKNAFSQGLFTQIKQNNGVNQNMAASALDYRSSLADALRPNNFNRLEHGLGQNATQFNRLSEIGNAAESRLNLPQNQRLWGQGDVQASPETSSFGQTLGQIKDKLQGNMLKNSTQNLLNPNFIGMQNNMLLGVYPNVGGVIPSQLYFENN